MKFKYAIVRFLPNIGSPENYVPFGVIVSDFNGNVAAAACLEEVPLPAAYVANGSHAADREEGALPAEDARKNGYSLKNPIVPITSFLRQSRRRKKKVVHALDHMREGHHYSIGICEPVGFAEECNDPIAAAVALFKTEVITHPSFPEAAKHECVSERI
jgi:hypothetical protein